MPRAKKSISTLSSSKSQGQVELQGVKQRIALLHQWFMSVDESGVLDMNQAPQRWPETLDANNPLMNEDYLKRRAELIELVETAEALTRRMQTKATQLTPRTCVHQAVLAGEIILNALEILDGPNGTAELPAVVATIQQALQDLPPVHGAVVSHIIEQGALFNQADDLEKLDMSIILKMSQAAIHPTQQADYQHQMFSLIDTIDHYKHHQAETIAHKILYLLSNMSDRIQHSSRFCMRIMRLTEQITPEVHEEALALLSARYPVPIGLMHDFIRMLGNEVQQIVGLKKFNSTYASWFIRWQIRETFKLQRHGIKQCEYLIALLEVVHEKKQIDKLLLQAMMRSTNCVSYHAQQAMLSVFNYRESVAVHSLTAMVLTTGSLIKADLGPDNHADVSEFTMSWLYRVGVQQRQLSNKLAESILALMGDLNQSHDLPSMVRIVRQLEEMITVIPAECLTIVGSIWHLKGYPSQLNKLARKIEVVVREKIQSMSLSLSEKLLIESIVRQFNRNIDKKYELAVVVVGQMMLQYLNALQTECQVSIVIAQVEALMQVLRCGEEIAAVKFYQHLSQELNVPVNDSQTVVSMIENNIVKEHRLHSDVQATLQRYQLQAQPQHEGKTKAVDIDDIEYYKDKLLKLYQLQQAEWRNQFRLLKQLQHQLDNPSMPAGKKTAITTQLRDLSKSYESLIETNKKRLDAILEGCECKQKIKQIYFLDESLQAAILQRNEVRAAVMQLHATISGAPPLDEQATGANEPPDGLDDSSDDKILH